EAPAPLAATADLRALLAGHAAVVRGHEVLVSVKSCGGRGGRVRRLRLCGCVCAVASVRLRLCGCVCAVASVRCAARGGAAHGPGRPGASSARAEAPARSLRAVLDDQAGLVELVADGVRGRPVLAG